MAGISRNRRFQKMRVEVLRPNFEFDVTLGRDAILQDYVTINTGVRVYIEPQHSEVIGNKQLGDIAVDRLTGFMDKLEDIKPNDILKETANRFNGNVITYWKVTGVLDYSRYGFHIRIDLDKMNRVRE